jgi:hypothetical protein
MRVAVEVRVDNVQIQFPEEARNLFDRFYAWPDSAIRETENFYFIFLTPRKDRAALVSSSLVFPSILIAPSSLKPETKILSCKALLTPLKAQERTPYHHQRASLSFRQGQAQRRQDAHQPPVREPKKLKPNRKYYDVLCWDNLFFFVAFPYFGFIAYLTHGSPNSCSNFCVFLIISDTSVSRYRTLLIEDYDAYTFFAFSI